MHVRVEASIASVDNHIDVNVHALACHRSTVHFPFLTFIYLY